jgi:lysyl-tRNA synthetase class 2
MTLSWQPTASLATLRLRAQLYSTIRQFFAARQVLEVETPILSSGCVPEPTIDPWYATSSSTPSNRMFLHTSPELAMKRLLAAGSGAIFQITKAFRGGEVGQRHNPEFSLLEWYRPDFNQEMLIAEVAELLQAVLSTPPIERLSYCTAFEKFTGLHPLQVPLVDLQAYTAQLGLQNAEHLDRETCLQFTFAHHIEPQLGQTRPTVITDFPATQAALARKRQDNPELAERFEFYLQGMELANGFYELTDAVEQRQRFEQELAKRQALNLPTYPLDERFLAALQAGLPNCAGVALGLDRLLMLLMGITNIREVLTFPIDLA